MELIDNLGEDMEPLYNLGENMVPMDNLGEDIDHLNWERIWSPWIICERIWN